MAMSSPTEVKKKKTKLEKIAELEAKLKLLKEENTRLKNELEGSSANGSPKKSSDDWSINDSPSGRSNRSRRVGGGDVEKLKDALRCLKRATVKQEMSLTSLRQKSKQRRQEIESKDQIIRKLKEENKAFRIAHEKLRGSGDDDVSALRRRIADLELQLAKEETSKEEQNRKLKKSEEGITSLKSQLADLKGRGVTRNSSFSSFMSDTSSGEDLVRLKTELAKKAEKIASLQYDLELCRDEVHDLRQRHEFNASFPLTPAPGSDDFFDDLEHDEDFWAN